MTVLALVFMAASPALAHSRERTLPERGDITINVDNDAEVENLVSVGAYTGANISSGDEGGNGGASGDATVEEKGTAETGMGGSGGDGGNGGYITTGNAEADATVINAVNSTLSLVDACGCSSDEDSEEPTCNSGYSWDSDECGCVKDITTDLDNDAGVGNGVEVVADTGLNESYGDEGGNGGASGEATVEGGDANDNIGFHHFDRCNTCDNDESEDACPCPSATSGEGGDAGTGGNGGTISTGDALSTAMVFNLVNTSITRVRR